jgi:hypothetical protein
MEKVYVMDNRGRETEAFKIRYFSYQDMEYFIYTLGEIDKDEYVKLYLKQLKDGEEQSITEEEWVEIKNIIQKVVKEIKNGNITSFKDLNMDSLNEIMENDTRVFKLKKDIVEQIIYSEPTVEIKDEPISIAEPEKDTFIENLEDTIKNTFSGEKKEEVQETKMKPIILGSLSNEYKEKCEKLEKELEDYKVIIYKLKEENNVLKKKLIEYHGRLEQVKKTIEGI